MSTQKTKKTIAIVFLFLLFLSTIPIPSVSALVWGVGVVYNCDNEYYQVTAPITVDNLTISTHWFSVNGIGFNTTAPNPVFINFSTIKSSPHSSDGYIMNFTEQHALGATQYIISGLKPSYGYIWITNLTDYPQTSSASGTLYLNQTGTSRNHKLYDPGIPTTGTFVSVGWGAIPAGSDTTGNGSYSNPYKTLRKALNVSTTGDTIYMRGGDYSQPGWSGVGGNHGLLINRSGITISNYNNEKVVINGTAITLVAGYGIFMLYDSTPTYFNNITIHGINISNSSYNGIVGGGTAGTQNDYLTINGCSFYNIYNRAIIMGGGSGFTIDYTSIINCFFNKIQDNTTMNECLSLMGCRGFTFANNSIRNFVKQFLSISGGSCTGNVCFNSFENLWYYSIKLDPYSNCNKTICNINIYNNMFFGTARSTVTHYPISLYINPEAAANGGSIHHINVYNNIFNLSTNAAAFQCQGLNIKLDLPAAFTASYIIVKHNTFYCTGVSASSYNLRVTKGAGTSLTNSVIANNIFYTDASAPIDQISFSDLPNTQTSFTVTNNQFYDHTGDGAAHGIDYSSGADDTGTNGLKTNPEFHAMVIKDFDINVTSPCKDSASAAYGVSRDYVWNSRPYDTFYDRGAYEYTTGVPSTPSFSFTGISPVNESTGVSLTPIMQVIIQETHGFKFNYSIKENTTGVWIPQTYASNVNNGTYGHPYHNATATSTKYWWRVDAWNGTTHQNYSYCFTTLAPAVPSFLFTGIDPVNTSIGISLVPTLHYTVSESHGYKFNETISWNHTGAWVVVAVSYNTNNGTWGVLDHLVTSYSTKYWWRIEAWNGSFTPHTETYYFTTMAAPVGVPPTIHGVHANWTTSTSINISWTKATGATHSYLYRSTLGYLNAEALIYNGIETYYNDTVMNPLIHYYYTLKPYNATTMTFGTPVNISLAETNPCSATTTGASWIEFQGWMSTDHNIWTRFTYGDNAGFSQLTTNETTYETGFMNTTGTYSSGETRIYTNHQVGQTFKTGATRYYLYNVTALMKRTGAPGTLYCYLYSANTSTYRPSGAILASGSLTGSVSTTGAWHNISMTPYQLLTNTRYCIVMVAAGVASNYITWNYDSVDAAPFYSLGQAFKSTDGGVTFNNITSTLNDVQFKIWGKTPVTILTGANTTAETIATSSLFDIEQTGLASGQLYYYRAIGNDTKGNMTRGNTLTTLTHPGAPIFLNINPIFANNSIHLTWSLGDGANSTVVAYSTGSYPTIPASGTIVYNGTGTSCWVTGISFNTSRYFSLFGYTTWAGMSRFSSATYVPWGGCSFIIRNESAPWQIINASVMVTDSSGHNPAYFSGVYGYYSFNITDIPYGENTRFYISNSSYRSRLYVYDIDPNIFYNFTFYLPPLHYPGNATENESASYMVQVINEQNYPVTEARVEIYRYMNYTDNYTYIGGFVSDGYGQGSIYLFPDQLYMVKIVCDGYQNATYFWTPNVEEQTLIKIFKLYYEEVEVQPPVYSFEDLSFTYTIIDGALPGTKDIVLTFSDAHNYTTGTIGTVVAFNYTTNTTIPITGFINGHFQTWTETITHVDRNMTYTCNLTVFHQYLGTLHLSLVIDKQLYILVNETTIDTLFSWLGIVPFGVTNLFEWLFFVAACYYTDSRDAGKVIIILGVIFLFIGAYVGIKTMLFGSASAIAGGAMPTLFIAMGTLMEWNQRKGMKY